MNCYQLSELGLFASILKSASPHWQFAIAMWLRDKFDGDKTAADAVVLKFSDSLKPRDIAIVPASADLKSSFQDGQAAESEQDLCRCFLEEWQMYTNVCETLRRLRRQGLFFCFKYRKEFAVYKQERQKLNKSYTLSALLDIACAFYVKQGLGDKNAAIKYFLGR